MQFSFIFINIFSVNNIFNIGATNVRQKEPKNESSAHNIRFQALSATNSFIIQTNQTKNTSIVNPSDESRATIAGLDKTHS